jgi:hypothetical protein
MDYMLLLLVVGGVLVLWRIVHKFRSLRAVREDDWDTKFIARLRRSGVDPFKPAEVDFFLALPSIEAAQRISAQLTEDLFTPDIRATDGPADLPISVHARKLMQVNESGIRTAATRLRELAAAEGGRYDGWAPGPEAMGALRTASVKARSTPRRDLR